MQSNSLDIDFIHGDIHSRWRENVRCKSNYPVKKVSVVFEHKNTIYMDMLLD